MKSEYKLDNDRMESFRNTNWEDELERKEDPIMAKEKKAMRHLIRDKRARFDFKTTDILKAMCCLRYFHSRGTLRKSPSGRVILNYKLGLEKIDKDLDISNIIKK